LKDIFMKKRMGNFPKGLWAYTSRLAGHLQSKETGLPGLPISRSPALFSGTDPFGLPPVPWTEETIES
jgi:hypothetical protein